MPRSALLLTLGALACRPPLAFTDPIEPDGAFPLGEPSAEALARYEAAADWSEAHHGLALLVLDGDRLVYQRYAPGWDASTPHHLFSGTKSFSCALVASAQAEGLLEYDDPAATWISAWQGDPEREEITLDHLLHFTSGLGQAWGKLTRDGMKARQRVEDKYALALELPLRSAPGERFEYGSSHLMVLGAALTAALGQDPVEAMEERFLGPIGFRYAGWNRDPAGNPMLPYGAWTTGYEWLKFGALVRDDGRWQGERVLPEGALAACMEGSAANPAYGRTLWLNRDAEGADLSAFASLEDQGPILWGDGPADLVAAAGYGDQRLYIAPTAGLVIARLGDGDRHFKDAELLRLLLGGE
ncbi:MAG: beta-lactamase family protein [Deltaproteobacteria bacterium]|nr:beta-lactamase family protein [Deltaproteobacteria bacterium]